MTIKEILYRMDNSKRDDGTFNNEINSYLPEIEKLIRSLETMSLDEFCLLQRGITPVPIETDK